MPYLYRSFSAKEPYNKWLFGGNNLQLKAFYGSAPRCSTGLRRLIGCLKLTVIFCKKATNHRARLRKMTYTDNPMSLHHPVIGISYELPTSYILG